MKNLRYALEIQLVRFGIWLLPKLPRTSVLFLSQTIGFLAYLIDYRGRATAHANLHAAFARENITAEQVRRIAIASYCTFARTFLDLFWSVRLTKDNMHDYFHDDPGNTEAETIAKYGHAIWVTPHFGNFEFISIIQGFLGRPFVAIAQNFKNSALTDIFTNLRQHSGHRIIPQQGAMLRLVKELNRGSSVALLSDLTIKPNKTAAALNSFGLKTCVTTLHTNLSQRLNLPLIASLCIPMDDSTYKFHFRTLYPGDYPDPTAMAQALWNHFESHIRERPECWLWMYKHWRYLPGTGYDPLYPAYANLSTPFRKLLRESQADAAPSS